MYLEKIIIQKDTCTPVFIGFFAWLAGFAVYQVAERLDSVFLGPTLIAVIVSAALAYARVLKFLFLNGHATEKDSAHQ